MDNVEKDSCGFSLIKPLVVVAIILIISSNHSGDRNYER